MHLKNGIRKNGVLDEEIFKVTLLKLEIDAYFLCKNSDILYTLKPLIYLLIMNNFYVLFDLTYFIKNFKKLKTIIKALNFDFSLFDFHFSILFIL